MKIIVTGGSGRLGHQVIQELLESGYEVMNLDHRVPEERLCSFRRIDLRDHFAVYQALEGADAAIHLAAIPSPRAGLEEEVFQNNVVSTFNILEAASRHGFQTVVSASSDSALGFPYARNKFSPLYVPIDEEHPLLPQDPYGLSKQVGEEICAMYSRRTGMRTVSLRFTAVMLPESYRHFPYFWEHPEACSYNLWSYVDIRDAARCCRLALEGNTAGHEAFFVAAPNTCMKADTIELLKQHYPGIREVRTGFSGDRSVLDTGKAQRLLGFRAEHTWDLYTGTEG